MQPARPLFPGWEVASPAGCAAASGRTVPEGWSAAVTGARAQGTSRATVLDDALVGGHEAEVGALVVPLSQPSPGGVTAAPQSWPAFDRPAGPPVAPSGPWRAPPSTSPPGPEGGATETPGEGHTLWSIGFPGIRRDPIRDDSLDLEGGWWTRRTPASPLARLRPRRSSADRSSIDDRACCMCDEVLQVGQELGDHACGVIGKEAFPVTYCMSNGRNGCVCGVRCRNCATDGCFSITTVGPTANCPTLGGTCRILSPGPSRVDCFSAKFALNRKHCKEEPHAVTTRHSYWRCAGTKGDPPRGVVLCPGLAYTRIILDLETCALAAAYCCPRGLGGPQCTFYEE